MTGGPSLCAFAVLIVAVAGTAPAAAASEPSFERDVWPVLAENCYGCHTAVDKKSKGGLSLDTRDEAFRGGDTGALLVPGKPDESLLLKMISGDKPEMPKKQPPLPAEQVRLLRD